MCIVLIEDDNIHAKLIKRALEKSGYGNDILCLEDGEKAVRSLFPEDSKERTVWPKLIILDINIPKINGIEILRRIKGDNRLKYVPVVILTTSRNQIDKKNCYKFCANSYVSKPLDFKELSNKIHSIAHYWLEINDKVDE